MKKILPLYHVGFFLAIALSITCYAQNSMEPALEHSLAAASLPISVRLNEIKPGGMIAKDAVNDKIQRAFNKSFSNAKNDQWIFIKKNVFGVSFDNNGRYSRAAYTKGGAMLYSVIQSSEKHLTKENRKAIKSNYFEYDITNVVEVASNGQTVWIVNLQNEENLVVVRVANGSLDELASYTLPKLNK